MIVRSTIPEGWRSEQVADHLAELGIVDRAEFMQQTLTWGHDQSGVGSRPSGASLEGYLFPDTYQFAEGVGTSDVIARMLNTFEARVTAENGSLASAEGMSLHELVTLASIVEREAVLPAERPRIARVFLNRLAEAPYLLTADPTVQYALGYQADANVWWKSDLTA